MDAVCERCSEVDPGKQLRENLEAAVAALEAKGLTPQHAQNWNPLGAQRCRFGSVRGTTDGLVLTPTETLFYNWHKANDAYSQHHNQWVVDQIAEGLCLGGHPFVHLLPKED